MMFRGVLIVILFFSIALIIFGSVIQGELITVDDPDQMHRINKRTAWNLEQTFIRNKTKGLYYRPLITLSFTADKLLWQADTRAMHLVNIFLHTLNALLVLLLTRYLLISHPYRWHFSVLGGLLFLCHPLTAESVNWLSGRTDLLAATFVYSSALSLIQFRNNKGLWWLLAGFLFAIMGVLAKETAIAFIAGIGFILWAQEDPELLNVQKIVQRGAVLVGLLSASAVSAWYFMVCLREFVLKADSSRIGLTLKIIDSDWHYAFFVCLRTLGFYFKKVFFPLPLSFAIVEVDPLYELLAIPLLVLLAYLFIKRTKVAGYALTGAVLVAPAFPIAFNQIAWTPYAERYVYIALGFVLPVVVYCLSRLRHSNRAVLYMCVLLVLLSACITMQRSWQWTSNELLWADTVEKSPLNEKSWNNYGVALMEQGRYSEAEKNFDIAAKRKKSGSIFGYKDKYPINMAVAMMERKDYTQAAQTLFKVLEMSKGTSDRALNVLLELVAEQSNVGSFTVLDVRNKLTTLADETDKAAYYYQLGRLEKHQKNSDLAHYYFERAYSQAQEQDPIRNKVAKELEKLVQEL